MRQDHFQALFADYLSPFDHLPPLRKRVLKVLAALPQTVRDDFLQDPRFHVALDNFQPGRGSQVWLAAIGPPGEGSRSVILKPRLADSSEQFAYYVIAHEFAHAFLRNGAWNDITDPEDAADALAAHWGFERPL